MAVLISTLPVTTSYAQTDSDQAVEATAQVDSEQAEATEQVCKPCFFEGEEIVDNLPKRKTTAREQKILDKTVRVIQRFGSQKDAFTELDKDHNCQLDRTEVNNLLSYAKVSGFVRVIASGQLITRYDLSHDGAVQWREFHYAVDKALAKQAAKKDAKQKAKETNPVPATTLAVKSTK